MLQPLAARSTIDAVTGDGHNARLAWYLAILVGLGVIRAGAAGIRRLLVAASAARIAADLRTAVYAHLQQVPLAYHQRHGVGELMARGTSDVKLVEVAVQLLPNLLGSVVLAAGSVAALVILDAPLGVACLLVLPPLAIALRRLVQRIHGGANAVQEAVAQNSRTVEELISAAHLIRAYGAADVAARRAAHTSAAMRDTSMALARVRARYYPPLVILPSLVIAIAALGGGIAVDHGALSAGTFFAFVQYAGGISAPLTAVVVALGDLPRGLAAADRIAALLAERVEAVGGSELDGRAAPAAEPESDTRAALDIDAVTFGYEPGRPVLRDVSLRVAAGSWVAVVGASGAGKSTLVRLISRSVRPWQGRIRLGGRDLEDLGQADLTASVSVVFQDTFLFSRSVRDNVAYATPRCSPEEFEEAVAVARVGEFVADLPHGVDTVVGERGFSLSGGQRQRVALARALLHGGHLLVLDDCTSAVDTSLEMQIAAGLRAAVRGRTVLIITSRPAMAATADRVVLLDQGTVLADGSHEELLARDPRYRRALGMVPVG